VLKVKLLEARGLIRLRRTPSLACFPWRVPQAGPDPFIPVTVSARRGQAPNAAGFSACSIRRLTPATAS